MTTILKKAILENLIGQTTVHVTMFENKGEQNNIIIKLELYNSNGTYINAIELEYEKSEYRTAAYQYLDILTEFY